MKNRTIPFSTATLLIVLFGIVVVLLLHSRDNFSQAYLENGDIFMSNEDRTISKQITFDGSEGRGIKYGYPKLDGEGDVLYLRCENADSIGDNGQCAILKFSISDELAEEAFSLSEFSFINPASIAWGNNADYLVFASQSELFLYKDGGIKSLLSWEFLNLGIGGQFCNGTLMSNDSEYFAFCSASAVGTSIQGNVYLFNSQGELIRTFKPSIEDLGRMKQGLVNPKFESGYLYFTDTSSGIDYEYNLSASSLKPTDK